MRYIAFLFAASCIDFYSVEDRASRTALLCDVDASSEMGLEVFLDPGVSESCVSQILEDFRAQDLTQESTTTLVNGSWALLNYDWDNIEHPSLYYQLETIRYELGNQPMGFVLYNWVTSDIKTTVSKELDFAAAAYGPTRDQLRLDEEFTPLYAAVILVHEAHHAGGSRHVDCPHLPKFDCDEDDMGAFSAGIALLQAAKPVETYVAESIELIIEEHKNLVLQ